MKRRAGNDSLCLCQYPFNIQCFVNVCLKESLKVLRQVLRVQIVLGFGAGNAFGMHGLNLKVAWDLEN